MELASVDIQKEVKLLERHYSEFRRLNAKWTTSAVATCTYPLFFTAKAQPSDSAAVYVSKRTQLKRSSKVFFIIRRFWQLINPLHLPGISKDTYRQLFSVLYKKFLGRDCDGQVLAESIENDIAIDFDGSTCLSFAAFYDGFFHYIDTITHSTLANEYFRIVSTAYEVLVLSGSLSKLTRYNRNHIPTGFKPTLPSWMADHLKPFPQTEPNKRPKIANSCSPRLVKRLLTKKQSSAAQDVELRRIEYLVKQTQRRIPGNNAAKIVLKNKFLRSIQKPQANPKSPVKMPVPHSARKRFKKHSQLLEEVIEGRKLMQMEVSQESAS